MPDAADIYGLTPAQHGKLSRLFADARPPQRPAVGVRATKTGVRPLIRVIAPASRTYDSRTATACTLFVRDTSRTIIVVEFVGSSLAGYIVLTINGVEFVLECRRTELASVVAAVPQLLRATVLPGLWELDFGTEPFANITVTAAAISGQAEVDLCALLDDEDCAFNGSAIIREEAWHTVTNAAGVTATEDIVDAIPFADGAIGPGAIGTACWSWDAGYVVTGWQCRQFSFAAGYDPTTDVIDPVTGEEDPTGGGGGGGLPSEEVPP